MYQSLIDTLNLQIKADLNQILSDTYLSQKKSTIVFQHIKFFNPSLRYKFRKFVEKLSYATELRLVLVMEEKEAEEHMEQDNNTPVVRMTYMERAEAVEFLKRILFIERKTELVRGINIDNHKVIDVWERMNFIDNEAFRISGSLNKRRKLIDIANDMEHKLSMSEN